MGGEEGKKVAGGVQAASAAEAASSAKDGQTVAPEEKSDGSKALTVVESKECLISDFLWKKFSHQILSIYALEEFKFKEVTDASADKGSGGSINRGKDAILAKVETEKRMTLIRAWEETEKVKAENKAVKQVSTITSWENTKKATLEADLKKMEEALEKKKAEFAEKMKNKIASVHKLAEEKRAMAEAKREEEILKAEEMAAKYRATGLGPKKLVGCF